MFTLLLLTTVLSAAETPGTPVATTPTVGAIRWDAWHGPASKVGLIVEKTLAPAHWHYRLPFYGKEIGENAVEARANTQDIMDREIEYAHRAGLDYWAFVIYPEDDALSLGLKLYLSSKLKDQVNFCLDLQGGFLSRGGPGAWPEKVERYVRYFRDPAYQTVLGDRPLVYLYSVEGLVGSGRFETWDDARAAFDRLRAATRAAGLADPYIVAQGWSPKVLKKQVADLGLDAIGAYASSAGEKAAPYARLAAHTEQWWDSFRATGAPVVPLVTAGWDMRPRVETPVPWVKDGDIKQYYEAPTPGELATHVEHALAWCRRYPKAAEAQTTLIYAWNEFDEGGWICPTLKKGDARLDAIAKVLATRSAGQPPVTTQKENTTMPTPESNVIEVRRFLPEKPISRALRPAPLAAFVRNTGDAPVTVRPMLALPKGVRETGGTGTEPITLQAGEESKLLWEVEATAPTESCKLGLDILCNGKKVAEATLSMQFLEPVEITHPPYIPAPKPANSPLLVGAHHCPLWEADRPDMWDNIVKHPERTPALGFYAQDNPEIADWETKWATEHGIDFFIYCWYRTSQGGPVETMFSSAIHEALFKSKFKDQMKFTIMWENQRRGVAGVADETDLMNNLLPFWMENYFKHPSYLKVDNRPVLFVYRPEFLVDDLGGVEQVAKAFDLMRRACRDAGFDGLYILGEYRGLEAKHLTLMKDLGLDYTFAYCWYVPDNPTPARAIKTQMEYIRKTQHMNILPQVVTVSQAWSGWKDEGTIWKIPPRDFETLLRQARDFVSSLPKNELGSRMLLLDNWNEWGEGHYIAPYREYGFGYVDAVRKILTDAPGPHTDLIPEDIGMGPYDLAYKAREEQP